MQPSHESEESKHRLTSCWPLNASDQKERAGLADCRSANRPLLVVSW